MFTRSGRGRGEAEDVVIATRSPSCGARRCGPGRSGARAMDAAIGPTERDAEDPRLLDRAGRHARAAGRRPCGRSPRRH
jgi:hypothetical protein